MKLEEERQNQIEAKMVDALCLASHVVSSGCQESAFIIYDETQIREKCAQIVQGHLKGKAKPYFDIFCNCDARVLNLLSEFGFGFRARSKVEVSIAAEAGIDSKAILFDSGSMLIASHIRFAAANGVSVFAVRSLADIGKVKKASPNSSVFLKVKNSFNSESNRTPYDETCELLRHASHLDIKVTGLAFEHDADEALPDYKKDLALAKLLVDVARKQYDHKDIRQIHVGLLDSHDDVARFSKLLVSGNPGLEMVVGLNALIVASAFSLCVKIIGKRESSVKRTFVINEGVFGHFGRILHRDDPVPSPINIRTRDEYETISECEIWGPSGEDLDVIGVAVPVRDPDEIKVGDWIMFPEMGDDMLTPANPTRTIHQTCGDFKDLRALVSETLDDDNAIEDSLIPMSELYNCGEGEGEGAVATANDFLSELAIFTHI